MNRAYLEKACEEVDASVFSGDVLFDDSDRVALREYAERWLRAIAEHERLTAEDIVNGERYLAAMNGIWERRDALGNEIERLRDLAANAENQALTRERQ